MLEGRLPVVVALATLPPVAAPIIRVQEGLNRLPENLTGNGQAKLLEAVPSEAV
jgi:hypothetical protein